jgi:hypothetical protein
MGPSEYVKHIFLDLAKSCFLMAKRIIMTSDHYFKDLLFVIHQIGFWTWQKY